MTELHRTFIYIDAAGAHWNCTVTPPCSLSEFQAAHQGCQCWIAPDVETSPTEWAEYVFRGVGKDDRRDRFAEIPETVKNEARSEFLRIKAEREPS
jgi:hypothetical protein